MGRRLLLILGMMPLASTAALPARGQSDGQGSARPDPGPPASPDVPPFLFPNALSAPGDATPSAETPDSKQAGRHSNSETKHLSPKPRRIEAPSDPDFARAQATAQSGAPTSGAPAQPLTSPGG